MAVWGGEAADVYYLLKPYEWPKPLEKLGVGLQRVATVVTSHGLDPIPHVIIEDAMRPIHSYKTAEGWKSEEFGSGCRLLDDPNNSAVLDSNNTLYCVLTHSGLILAKKPHNGQWSYENIPYPSSQEWSSTSEVSLAVDSQNRLHIAVTDGKLFYGVKDGLTWAFQEIDMGLPYSLDYTDVTLKLDNYGLPRIVYSTINPKKVYYAEAHEKELPEITSIANQKIAEGELLELKPIATNSKGTELELFVDFQKLPQDLKDKISTAIFTTGFNSETGETFGTFHWTPALSSAGIYYPVVFVAKDPETGKRAYETVTIVVYPQGSTPVLPGEFIQEYIDNSVTGDALYVFNGLYEEDLTIKDKDIALQGESRSNATVYGNIVFDNSDSSIENMDIFYSNKGLMNYSGGNYVNFMLLNDAGITAINSDITIKNCHLQPYTLFPIIPREGKAIQIWNLYESKNIAPTIKNNLIHYANTGIYLFSQAFGGTIGGEIKNNTLDRNTYGIVLRTHRENPNIANNIITRSQDAISLPYSSLLTERLSRITNNCFGGGGYANTHNVWCDKLQAEQLVLPDAAGNIAEDPEYFSSDYYPRNPNCADKGYRLK